MHRLDDLKERYEALRWEAPIQGEGAIRPETLLAFAYEYPGSGAEVAIETDEFTALCPWTGLPDFGRLRVRYVPRDLCLELKSFKYYLLCYRNVGIVQEHAASRVLGDLVAACSPAWMELTLDYNTRGGVRTTVTVRHPPTPEG